ncbi:MAG: polysaccharide biosynthesis C-terminal domain-containing protein [Bacteroidales bacterium]|nr:polysaccharide biosynthesis C-terminal domain-containing protein [Bacteroidales bacterium]
MGLIAKQTIKGSIYSYLGAFIGFVNVALLMPQIFTTDEIGLTNLLIALSSIVGQFGCFGFTNVIVRFFPYFRDPEHKHNGFPFLLVAVGIVGSLVCTAGYFGARDYLVTQNIEKSKLFADYVFLLLPLIYITIFYLLSDVYNRMFYNSSFGLFVKEFLLRILNLIGIGLFYFGVLDFNGFIIYYVAAYGVPTVLLLILLIVQGNMSLKPSKKLLTREFVRAMCSVAFYGVISSFSGVFVNQIDRYFINHYCDLGATGVYSIAFYFGSMILLPGRSIVRISSTVITESFKSGDDDMVLKVYRKCTTNMLIIGVILFVLVWGNIGNILKMLPPEYADGRLVILFIAISHLIQMAASVSGEIIQYSKYYRYHTLIMVILIGLIFGFNVWLLPIYGITGAAVASMLSFLVYSLVRIAFVKLKFGFNPFCLKHLLVLLFGAVAYLLSWLMPDLGNLILDLAVRSAVICIVFVVPTLYFDLSEDMTAMYKRVIGKVFRKK